MVALPDAGNTQQPIKSDGLICDFGKHKGTPYTRLPVSYLQWMVSQQHSRADVAQAELDRRGTRTPELDLTAHAIDRASIKCGHIWNQTRRLEEGLHSWLARVSKEAIEAAENDATLIDAEGRVHHGVMVFVFDQDSEWPILKTVYPEKGHYAPPSILELIEERKPRWAKARKAYTVNKGNW